MIWGAIVGGVKSELVLWERDNWGTITANTYLNHVFHPILRPFWYHQCLDLGRWLWVMEDGASAHRANITKAERAWNRMPSLEWPPSSPDLNPIENIWELLKDKLDERVPRPKGTDQMRVAILEEWERITTTDLLKHIDSMPARMAAVITANGGHTRW